jgi:hypothetical protein
MKLTIVASAVAATLAFSAFAPAAQARENHHGHAHRHHYVDRDGHAHHHHYAVDRHHGHPHHHRYAVNRHDQETWHRDRVYDDASAGNDQDYSQQWSADTYTDRSAGTHRGGLGGRPSAWCGWQMRQLVGGDPGPEYNLARNWAHWGRSGPAGVGAVVVWPHHVGKIVGQQFGMWIVESGNDGHRLRTRPRSIAGAVAIRWG